MRVYGLDFTSSPTDADSQARTTKRLTLAVCKFDDGALTLENFQELNKRKDDFSGFENWLSTSDEEWIAGVDFPFGQPSKLVVELGWPRSSWSEYVKHVKSLGKAGFEKELNDYKEGKPKGQKHIKRTIDKMTDAHSPMTLEHTPVGKMFFQGSYRLCNADVSILPVREIVDSQRLVIEAYPALVARKWTNRNPQYKSEDPQTADDLYKKYARCDIVSAIRGNDNNNYRIPSRERYGFSVLMTDADACRCIDDYTGDTLDSVLCAIQAAWAYTKRNSNYGIPVHVDRLEGWICDPETVTTNEGIGVAYFQGRPNAMQTISESIEHYPVNEFNSPRRSTIPMLSLMLHNSKMFNEIVTELEMPTNLDLFLEHQVKSPADSHTYSDTDVMLKSSSDVLAIEAKWTEPMCDDVKNWLPTEDGIDGPAVLKGWLDLLLKVIPKRGLRAEDFDDVIYQMIHRAASAAATGFRPRLAYFLFKSSPDLRPCSTDEIKTELTCLWTKLGKTNKFPFFVVEIEMADLPAYATLRDLPSCEETAELVRSALQSDQPLFEFQSHRIIKIGEEE